MSTYFESRDSSDDEEAIDKKEISEVDEASMKEAASILKTEGNSFFSQGQYSEALEKYSEAINILKRASLPKDAILLLNRSATYLAIKKYVPALNDANQAVEIDSSNWKGHWRKGVALMSLSKRSFRTKQAIEAFQACLACDSLPENKKSEVLQEINKAKARLEQQDAETPPADLSRCAQS